MVHRRRLVIIACCALLLSLVLAVLAKRFITIDMLKMHRVAISCFVERHYVWSVIAYMLLYGLAASLAMPGIMGFTVAGGFLFGVWATTLYVIGAATLGACVIFLLSRFLLQAVVRKKIEQRFAGVYHEMNMYGPYYLFLMRLIPLFPFFLVNIVASLTKISLPLFIATTAIGIIPSTIIYAYAGTQLMVISSMKDLVSPGVVLALALLVLLAVVPFVVKRLYKRS